MADIHGWSDKITKSFEKQDKYGFPEYKDIATYELMEIIRIPVIRSHKQKAGIITLWKKAGV
jgi:hypothetical protein